MGICHEGKKLKEAVDTRRKLFEETGYVYGLEKLELVENDPAKFMRFQMRLVAACVAVRETAKLISNNPISAVMGELCFLPATPEGDVAAASYGLLGHIQSVPFIVRSIADLDFEEAPGIRPGDIFSTNDPWYGGTHASDCFTLVPVFYDGELIAWTVGLNHITDVGALQPGNLSNISWSTFTDGFVYPPTKTGENFTQHKWWELYWKRRTRTEAFNVLDDKMRVTGAVTLHNKMLEIVEEFGLDYFRRGLREIVERERRVLIQRIKAYAVPGVYAYLDFNTIRYKGMLTKLVPEADRDWLIHYPAAFQVLSDGRMFADLEGLSSEGAFFCNATEPALRMMSSLGCWSTFAYTQTINTALLYVTEWNLPAGSMFNPQNPFAATVMSVSETGRYMWMFENCLTYAYFARGFLEECFPQEFAGLGWGLAGVLADGFPWAGGDLSLITCCSSNALPFKDGDVASRCAPNPQSDFGETEQSEFLQPTNLNIGRKLVPNYCGHGKFRGGLGICITQLVDEPGKSLTVANSVGTGEVGRAAMGMAGGYPGPNDLAIFVHNTNMREILEKDPSYPKDFVEVREWLKEGKMKAGSVEIYTRSTPNVQCKDGDIYSTACGGQGGWGDPLERFFSLVERDVHYGWITPDVAETVYGAVTDEEGKVKVKESEELRRKMRLKRKERSVDAGEWWRRERQRVMNKEFSEDVYNMYADILKYEKFRHQFMGMWQLSEGYQL